MVEWDLANPRKILISVVIWIIVVVCIWKLMIVSDPTPWLRKMQIAMTVIMLPISFLIVQIMVRD